MNQTAFVVPANYNDLVRDFGAFVSKVVQRYNNVPRHSADLLQDVWMHLIASDVLAKFWANLQKPPRTLTGLQAAEYCNVSFKNFKTNIWRRTWGRDKGWWVPLPIKGYYTKPDALYKTEEIIKLRESGVFQTCLSDTLPELPGGACVATRGRFESYLTTCIHNHFANFCRTRERRDQDVYLAPREDGSAWESHLHDCDGVAPDEVADLSRALNKLGDTGRDVLRLLEDGYTLTEACQRLDLSINSLRLVAQG